MNNTYSVLSNRVESKSEVLVLRFRSYSIFISGENKSSIQWSSKKENKLPELCT